MSTLSLFRPDCDLADEPAVVAFPLARKERPKTPMLRRAKAIAENQTCCICGTAKVTPLELADAELDKKNRRIPGTATVVGFHCQKCHHEWPAE